MSDQQSNNSEPKIKIIKYPPGTRFIGPGDDLVISAEVLAEHYLLREQVEADKALLLSDLAWCLGKLRGLGYASENLEEKYHLGLHTKEKGQI